MSFRLRVSFNGSNYYIVNGNKFKAPTKQLLYKQIKEEFQLKAIRTRKNNIICIE